MKSSVSRFASPLFAASATAAALVFSVTSSGCGSGGGTAPAPGVPGVSAGSSAYSGRAYTSQVALAEGQVGNLSLSVSGDTVSGTLQIVDPSRAVAAKTRIVIAMPSLSGMFDPDTGTFSLSGSYTIAGQTVPLSIVGTLPIPPATTGGTVTVTVNGQSFTSTFGGTVVNPTPTPSASASASPSPSPSGTASPSPSPSASPTMGSGIANLTVVSKGADCNFPFDSLQNLKQESATYNGAAGTGIYAVSSVFKSADGNNQLTVSWTRLHAQNGLTPETFTFTPNPAIGAFGDDFQGILGTAVTAQLGRLSFGAWSPTGGKLIVESVSGKTITLRGENVEFTPNRFNAISATGSFTANFTAVLDNVKGL